MIVAEYTMTDDLAQLRWALARRDTDLARLVAFLQIGHDQGWFDEAEIDACADQRAIATLVASRLPVGAASFLPGFWANAQRAVSANDARLLWA
jgi:hypothetical protein